MCSDFISSTVRLYLINNAIQGFYMAMKNYSLLESCVERNHSASTVLRIILGSLDNTLCLNGQFCFFPRRIQVSYTRASIDDVVRST